VRQSSRLYHLAVTTEIWPSEWYRAILWACALSVIDDLDDDAYGYNIGTHLSRRRLGSITGGTLYPLLKRLEADGLVTTHWREGHQGPGRKHYRLTAPGRRLLAEVADRWSEFTEVSTSVLKGDRNGA
jgi:PadR family transcriptional regulator PadR